MLVINEHKRFYVYTDPVDMRKSIDGLSGILVDLFDKNPQTGDCYIFVNRQRNKIKCLVWDSNGFVLYYKRLEKNRFNYSKHISGNEITISIKQFNALLMGLDFHLLSDFSEEMYEDFF